MAKYAYGTPREDSREFVYKSLTDEQNPVSRFLWSYFPNCDLNRLKTLKWEEMTADEINCWKHAHRLLDFKPGDWVLHINVPEYGKVTAARITSEYEYQDILPESHTDGRHYFRVKDIFTFDRNDKRVHRKLSSRLKLQGCLWQVYCEDEFNKSLNLLQGKSDKELSENHFLVTEANEMMERLTKTIQSNKPGKDMEHFLAEVFKKIPNVIDVKENCSGWKTDYGADLIVIYKTGLLPDLESVHKLVVQVKSYEGDHWETNAVAQLKTAITQFNASSGMLMTTGNRTEALERAFDSLAKEMEDNNIPVRLLAGSEVAQFVLQYGMDVLLGEKN